MANSSANPTDTRWRTLRVRLLLCYLLVSAGLLAIGMSGQLRLLHEVGHTFGGFVWGLDADGQVVLLWPLTGQLTLGGEQFSLVADETIVQVNGQSPTALPVI
ncbi:MAG TPA: hypothetical protein VGF67_24075, partial [Ktedonobacteraceae bacterium]